MVMSVTGGRTATPAAAGSDQPQQQHHHHHHLTDYKSEMKELMDTTQNVVSEQIRLIGLALHFLVCFSVLS
jgi:hypothetical protein